MEGEWRGKLLHILEARVDESDLKKIAYFLLGPGSYDNLRGEAKAEKALSLLEQLHFRGRVDDLVGYIEETRPDIAVQDLVPEKSADENEIEFMNRVSEVHYITNPYSPSYLLVSAPLGYGKTRLLQAVRALLQSDGWFCVACTLESDKIASLEDVVNVILHELGGAAEIDPNSCRSPKEYGYLIAEFFVKHLYRLKADGALLLLDQVEALEEETASQFLNEVIPGLNRGLRSAGYLDQLKVVLSGCYVSDWERLSKIPLSLMPVTPFNFRVVQKTVQRFMSNEKRPFPIKSIQEIAAHIMYLTGGHPGCMVQLLKRFSAGWPAREFFIGKEAEHYEQVVAPVIRDVRQHIPVSLHDVFDTLSVVRYFNSRFLRHLIDRGLVRWSKSEYELEDKLTRTHLVTRTHGFLHDAITQRLLSIRLRKLDLDYFLMVNKEAIDFYESSLRDSGVNRPDMLAIELLFQKLQFIHYRGLGGKQEVLDAVPMVLEILTTGRDNREMIRSCEDLLKDDWEFRFLFNYLLQDNGYDHESPYVELVESVTSFLG
jgi:hypothetical protein